MAVKNEMQTIRETLLGEAADRRKLDMLVRQGMMSPAALPMLHRGLDKLQQGKTLNPMERDAVAKVVDSLMYIVTGDDTVFQKARQHTQKNKYQTEDIEEVEEKMDMKKADMGDVIKDFQSSDAPQFKGKTKDKKREMAIAAKLSAEETEQLDEYGNYSVGIKGQGGTTVKARSDKEASQKAFKNMGIADRHRKTMSHTVKKVGEETVDENRAAFSGAADRNKMLGKLQKAGKTASEIGDPKKRAAAKAALPKIKKRLDYGMKEESPAPDNLDSSYKAKFAAMLKKTGKSLAQMSDEEKKKFFNSVDDAHKAKNEEMQTTGPGVKMMKPVKGVGGKTQKVGGKLSHPPRKPNRLKPDPMMTKSEEAVDEGAMKRMATQQQTGEKGSGLETYKKKPAAKDTMVASPKTQRVKMTTAKAAKRMVAKGAVYAEDARSDARRAMRSDSKGMAPLKRPGATKAHTGTKAGDEKHGGHIVMQLRKAVSISKPVRFKDGSTKPVSKAHAHKFLSKYNAGKPAEKEAMHGAHDSHDAFMKHINK